MLAVHLRINDSITKKPVPVRLAITGPQGTPFAPLGRLTTFACGIGEDVGGHLRLNRESYSYIDGACEVRLPAGVPLRFRATKGIGYRPLDQTMTLGHGQLTIRMEIQPVRTELTLDRWISADARCHFLGSHAARLEAAAEGLDLVNVLAKSHFHLANDGHTHAALPGLVEFSGQTPSLNDAGSWVIVNTFNVHPVLGSLSLLNCHRPVFPLAFGEPYETDDWSLLDWCQQCHRKNGLVVWANAFQPDGGESLVAAILGKIDAFELSASTRQPVLPVYYRLLNAGFRLPLVGASAKDSNRTALGALRTLTRIGEVEPTPYAGWIRAVRSGHSCVTNGPILDWSLTDSIGASALSLSAFENLELIADGRVIAAVSPTESDGFYRARIEAPVPDAAWIAFRTIGGVAPLDPGAPQFAHSSPVILDQSRRDPRAAKSFVEHVERLRSWGESRANFTESRWRDQLLANCDAAINLLRSDTP